MIWSVLSFAALTGVFCLGCALTIRVAANKLGEGQIALFNCSNGFLGSLFEHTVLLRCQGKDQ